MVNTNISSLTPLCHVERSRDISFLRPRVAGKTPSCGSHILTMQRYYIMIAVNECFSNFLQEFYRAVVMNSH